jgi:hypothetical protein
MPTEQTLETFLTDIDRLIELSDVNRVSELGASIGKTAIKLKDSAQPISKSSKELKRLAAAVDGAAARLAHSVLNLKRAGILQEDWARFAQRDVLKLKDEVLAFREFLVANSEFLKSAFRPPKLGDINLERLVEELHEEQAISERTWAMFMCHFAKCRPKRKHLKDSKVAEQLARIRDWLSDFREIKQVNANAQ